MSTTTRQRAIAAKMREMAKEQREVAKTMRLLNDRAAGSQLGLTNPDPVARTLSRRQEK